MISTPAPVLDCLAFDDAASLQAAVETLGGGGDELLPVETCERFELYRLGLARREWPAGATWLASQSEAATRLFALAAGDLSAIPGERAVATQLKAALRHACRLKLTGPHLLRLTQRALETGEEIRRRVERVAPILELADLVAERVRLDLAALEPEAAPRPVVLLGAGSAANAIRRALAVAGIEVTHWATRRPAAHRGPTLSLEDARRVIPTCRVLVTALGGSPAILSPDLVPRGAVTVDLAVPGNLPSARWPLARLVEAASTRLAPQREALARANHRLASLAATALAEIISPSIGAVAQTISRFRRTVVESELARLESLLESLPEADADRIRRSMRHAAARCTHPLHEYVNRLGRQHRVGEAASVMDHLPPPCRGEGP